MPLLALQRNLDARPFTLLDRTTERDDQSLNVGKDYCRRGWAGKDGLERLSVFGVHGAYASTSC